jgi:uncharacterized LabA/DUF88 family protein
MKVDPETECEECTTKHRIKQMKKIGIELKVYKSLTTKQAMQKKEEEFEKQGKKYGILNMKRKVYRWLGREKSDIREKIEEKRMEYTRKLKEHRKLLREIELIKQRNERDGRFMPLLEEAREKNRVMLLLNYKDHINKVLRNRMENH